MANPDCGKQVAFNRAVIRRFDDRITAYKIQYWGGGPMHAVRKDTFPTVTAAKARLFIVAAKGGQPPSIRGFSLYHNKS